MLIELSEHAERHRDYLIAMWSEAYVCAFGHEGSVDADEVYATHGAIVSSFINRLKQADLKGFLDRICEIGRQLEARGINYERMMLSLWYFEKGIVSSLTEEYHQVSEFLKRCLIFGAVMNQIRIALAASIYETKFATLRALESVSEAAMSTMDIDALMGTLLQHIVDALAADRGAILLLNENTQQLAYRALVGETQGQRLLQTIEIGQGLAGQVAVRNAPVSLPTATADVDSVSTENEPGNTGSSLGVPLRSSGLLIGVLCVSWWNRPHTVFPSEVELLETMASRAAIAIANARLFAESTLLASQLAMANRDLRILDQLKSDFLSIVSHELRTPLTAILGYAELMLKGIQGDLTPRSSQYVKTIHDNGRRLLTLINDLLDFSSIEAGRISLNVGTLQLRPVMDSVALAAKVNAGAREVDVELVMTPDLPPVLADEQRVRQILDHLISNAIKFTPHGGRISLEVERYCSPTSLGEDCARVSVTDTGIGIPAGEIDRIWDRFYQVEASATRRYGGTGLGLAVVKTLVEMQGGQVWVESEGLPGKGSAFYFTLPLAPQQE